MKYKRLITLAPEMAEMLDHLAGHQMAGLTVFAAEDYICSYCDAPERPGVDFEHRPDCPIVKARALLDRLES